MAYHKKAHGIALKKKFGQHFLRDQSVVDTMLNAVVLTAQSSIFEIGPGSGFLTRSILEQPFERLWVFEIDAEWAKYIKNKYGHPKMVVFQDNILDVDFSVFEPYKPWTLLANLPYQVTFPILFLLAQHRHILKEGVIMVQEEVAQKIVKKTGRGYGYNSLYLQHYFDWTLLRKVPPRSFYPPPKVESRLLYFKPRQIVDNIVNQTAFWKFIKRIFASPRRTIKNNLAAFHYNLAAIPTDILSLRAQQMSKADLIAFWHILEKAHAEP